MSPFRYFRMLLLRWHRRLGVVLLVFIVMLVVTGIAINHSASWGLDKSFVQQTWLLNYYGISEPELRSYRDQNDWLAQSGASLYLNENPIGSCDGLLLGAVKQGEDWLVLCEGRLQVFNLHGARLDDISESLGLPPAVSAIAANNNNIYLRTSTATIQFDPALLTFTSLENPMPEAKWAAQLAPPQTLREVWLSAHRGNGVNWERVLLDLHSGRLFGPVGVILTDIAAVLLLLLALSGVWVWVSKPGRWR
ncbi:PepSY domain-containing protein [Zhongshania arctica]|uniref:PepSY domain-containing protein n=1 Tax=Zhongshania arctica TaxID=3238302 RepID=A0ABV3TSV7_9GAMM